MEAREIFFPLPLSDPYWPRKSMVHARDRHCVPPPQFFRLLVEIARCCRVGRWQSFPERQTPVKVRHRKHRKLRHLFLCSAFCGTQLKLFLFSKNDFRGNYWFSLFSALLFLNSDQCPNLLAKD